MRILSGIVTLIFILVEVLIPLIIHGFLSRLILRCESTFTGACLFTILLNCVKKDENSSSTSCDFGEIISFQFVSDKSLLDRSTENYEKSRFLIVLFVTLSLADVRILNCEK